MPQIPPGPVGGMPVRPNVPAGMVWNPQMGIFQAAPPPGPVQVGPSQQQVLDAGGTYNYARNANTTPGVNINPPDTYSLPIGPPPGPVGARRTTTPGVGAGDPTQPSLTELMKRITDLSPEHPIEPAPAYEQPAAAPNVAPLVLPQHAQADPAMLKAASDAAYATAKDRIGLQGRASLNALRDMMSERGMAGGGMEAHEGANLIGGAQGELGAVAREQSQQEFARANAVADQVYGTESAGATTNFQGNLSQREGNANRALSGAGTKYQGAITSRGQTINANEAKNAGRRASLQVLASASNGRAY